MAFEEHHIGLVSGVSGVFVLIFQTMVYPRLDARFGTLHCFRTAFLILIPTTALYPYARFLLSWHDAVRWTWGNDTEQITLAANMALEAPGMLMRACVDLRPLHNGTLMMVSPNAAMCELYNCTCAVVEATDTLFAFWPTLIFMGAVARLGWVVAYSGINILIANLSPSNLIGATNGLSATFASASRFLAPAMAGSIFSLSANFGHFPIDASFAFLLCSLICMMLLWGAFRLKREVNVRRETVA